MARAGGSRPRFYSVGPSVFALAFVGIRIGIEVR